MRALASVTPTAAPGERWQYSNANYNVLGLIVDTLSGLPYADYVRQRVLTPLGMDTSTFDPAVAGAGPIADGHVPPFGRYRPVPVDDEAWLAPAGGALFSTASDMARYATFHLGAGPDAVLPPEEIEKTHTGTVPAPGLSIENNCYGFGWVDSTIGGRRIVWHDGGVPGYSAVLVLVLDPDRQLTAVVLLGATSFLTQHLVRSVAAAVYCR